MKYLRKYGIITLITILFVNIIYTKNKVVAETVPIIQEGFYQIVTNLDSNKVLDIANPEKGNEANVQIYSNTGEDKQLFKLRHLGANEYEIINYETKRALDVKGAETKNGTNVQLYDRNGTNAQIWKIENAGGGLYFLKSKCSGKYLDIASAEKENGTNVQIYEGNKTNAQKFKFIKKDIVSGQKTISDGYYSICTRLNTGKVLDVSEASKNNSANVQIWDNVEEKQQIFKVKHLGSGYYTLENVNSGKVLDVQGAEITDGTNVQQYESNGTDAQKWVIKETEKGIYNIISRCNGLYLDVARKSTSNGTNIRVCEKSGLTSQDFIFKEIEVIEGTKSVENGTYKISLGLDKEKVLDISAGSNSNGANVQVWDWANVLQQKYYLQYLGDGYYKITSAKSGKVIDVSGGYSDDGTNVQQYEWNNTDAQKWIIRKNTDGSYNIISKLKDKFLTVQNGKTTNGTNVAIYKGQKETEEENTKATAQKFYLEKVNAITLSEGTYGYSGLAVQGSKYGSNLKYYKIGSGPNVFFATFAIHGWEDSYGYDGQELTKIAERFKDKLLEMQDEELANKWTIYILPSLNPDGEYHGYSHNGPGRCSLYSSISSHKGMDINRCWSTSWERNKNDRNYNGTAPFQSYESQYLRDFLLSKRALNGMTVLVDLHGWLDETIGDEWIGSKYAAEFGFTKYINTYGKGYLVNWARSNLGYKGRVARSALIELPMVSNSRQVEERKYAEKYINATITMLREMW